MRTVVEYALVVAGALFIATAFMQLAWYVGDSYPRSLPTLFSIFGCAIGGWQCLSWAGVIAFGRLISSLA